MSDQQAQPPPGQGPSGRPGAGPAAAAGAQAGQPSEEEIRQYLAQLREADAAEIVAQAFNVLASGAQVKLGRSDGRLLIDLVHALREAAGDRVDERLTSQMDDAVSQLRAAQVQAEGEMQQQPGTESAAPQGTSATSPAEEPGQQQRSSGSGGSQLWTPGG